MPSEQSSDVKFEIGHVLFFDIVGYSKLLINEQSEQIRKLKEIVRGTEQFRLAEAEGKLLRLPTGDGGALVFRNVSEAPVLCAVEISKEFKRHPELRVRMGIHSGPVNEITDLNEQANIAGAGINIAQRVMDCGDAGHILLSKHVADDLEQYPQWRPHLHDLGECEVKHGTRVHLVNLYTDELGNPEVPEKFKDRGEETKTSPPVSGRSFFEELKRRRVYRVALGYAIAASATVQVAGTVLPIFHVPEWVQQLFVVLIASGFPCALMLAWAFDITSEGIQRTSDVSGVRVSSSARQILALGIASTLIAALALTGYWFWHPWARPSTALRQATAAIPLDKSIAVLPFENLSRDPDNAYFATGIQDEILTRIAKIGALKVISRVSTKQYSSRPDNLSEIAHQLGVANILEGSVQRAAGQVHVNVQLISAATDEHLWAESYDRKLENIFGVEAEVAAAVAEALKAKLTGAEQHALEQKPTSNPQAYDAYLRGIAQYGEANTIDEFSKSRQPFEEAVRLDPNFAMAWAMLVRLDAQWYFWVEAKPDRRAAAQKSLEAALRLRPDLPEVQLAQAFYQYCVLGDPEGARPSFERLLTKLPNDTDIPTALMFITLRQGRWDESRAYVQKAIELNPRDRWLRIYAAWVRNTTRDFAAALRCYDEALSIWPEDPYLIAGKASVYQSLGELDKADALLQKLHPAVKNDAGIAEIYYQAKLRRSYSDTIGLLRSLLAQAGSLPVSTQDYRLYLCDLERLSGDVAHANASYAQERDAREQMLKEERDDGSISYNLAEAYAGLGDGQLAMKYIERAISLKPASRDAWVGPRCEETRARIAARFGQKDLAISILAHLLTIPYQNPITPALLRLDPDFDLLRGDPRFDKLEAQAEPNTTSK